MLKQLLQRSDREVKVAKGRSSHTRRCCEKTRSCIREWGVGWEQSWTGSSIFIVFLSSPMVLFHSFREKGKAIVPLGAKVFGVFLESSSNPILSNSALKWHMMYVLW